MSDQVPVNFAIKFKDDFLLLSQQRQSRLMGTVRNDPDDLDGKMGYFDRIAATKSQKKTTRHGDTPLINTKHSRRRIIRDTYEWADMIDRSDVRRMMKNPQNRYVRNAIAAQKRDIDDAIIAAALGSSWSIDEADGATEIPLPGGQKVPVGTDGLTLDKLLAGKEIIDGSDVDEDEPRFCIVTSKQVTELLKTTEVKSADYNSVKALSEGKIDTFLGFKFIRSERLTRDGNNDRQVLMYASQGIGLAADDDPFTDIGPRRDKQVNVQIYMEWEIGATRIEDEKVVEIACKEAA